ncbi:hypothetical protein CFC21_048409 [Triticum aestivum]|uniref:Uncharacterized protein n=2 Tax=Triticum aestivum TaxID=4565 RepID=A0A9R1G0C8_WHEAT|nr:hypothetical protein CFC21_048409 [Triticum aestivum]
MDKYRNRLQYSIVLAMLLLILFATRAQCRILEDVENVKIKLDGLCARDPNCKNSSLCFCCFANHLCYPSLDDCMVGCRNASPLDPAAAMIRSPSPSYLI